MKICERCGQEHDGGFGSGRFCSRSCANGGLRYPNPLCHSCGKELVGRNWKKKAKYCSNKCQRDYEYNNRIKDWKEGKLVVDYDQVNSSLKSYIKRYMFEKYGSRCSKCGWGEVNPYSGKVPLEVEHRDGNFLNNVEENLDLLCPNCHSLTSTYKALNKGNGRKAQLDKRNNK